MATYPFIPYPSDEEWAMLDAYQPRFQDFDSTPFVMIGHLNNSTSRPDTPVYANAKAQIRMSSRRGPILEYPAKLVDDAGRPFCIVDIPHYCPDNADTTSIPKANLFSALDSDIPRKFYNPHALTATTTLWSVIAGLLDANEKGVKFSLRCEMQNRYSPPPGISRRPIVAPESRKVSVSGPVPQPSPLAIPSPIPESPSILSLPHSQATVVPDVPDEDFPPETELEPEGYPKPEAQAVPEPVTYCQCGNPLPPTKAPDLPPKSASRNPSMAHSAAPEPSPERVPSTRSVSPATRPVSRQPSIAQAQPSFRQPSLVPQSRQPSIIPGSRQPTFSTPSRQQSIAPVSRQPTTVPISRQPTFSSDPARSRQPSMVPEPTRRSTLASQVSARNASIFSPSAPLSPPLSPDQDPLEPDEPPLLDDLELPPNATSSGPRRKVPGHGPTPASAPSISTESDETASQARPPSPPPLPPVSAQPSAPIHPRVSIAPQLRLASREPMLVGSPTESAIEPPLTSPALPSPPRIGRVPTILSKLTNEPKKFALTPAAPRRDSTQPAKKYPPLTREELNRTSPLEELRKAVKARRLSHRQRNVNDETMTIMTEALAALEQSMNSALDVNDQLGDEQAMRVNREVAEKLNQLKQRFGEDLVGALKKLDEGET